MKIYLSNGQHGTFLVTAEDGRDILIQTDWDYPGVASTFGWSPCKGCRQNCKGATDGTVDCKKRKATDMICRAGAWLSDHDGAVADDPGYFQD